MLLCSQIAVLAGAEHWPVSAGAPCHQQQRCQPGCRSSRTTSQHMPWPSSTPQPQPAPRDDSEPFDTPLWVELCFRCDQSWQGLPGLYLIRQQSSLFRPVAVQKVSRSLGQCEDSKGRSPFAEQQGGCCFAMGVPSSAALDTTMLWPCGKLLQGCKGVLS